VQTFFNNLTYVEPCAMVLKGILDPRPKCSVKNSFAAAFKCPLELYVEEADGKFSRHRPLEASEAFNCSYLQLWLFAMRNFPDMTRITVKKEVTEPRRYANEPNAWLWHDFAALAARLGFSTSRISEILSTNPSMIHARRMLLDARPSDQYCFDDGELERYTGQISEMIKSAKRLPVPSSESQILRSQSCTEARNRRCGRPHEFSHAADKALLFLPTMQSSLGDIGPVNSFFVKKDFVISFFGRDWNSTWCPLLQKDESVSPVDPADALDPETVHKEKAGQKICLQHKVLQHLHDQSQAANCPHIVSI
jgi:hypothetical protein